MPLHTLIPATHPAPGIAVLRMPDEIDVYSTASIRQAFVDAVAEDRYHLVIDLADVEYCDSTGLGVLVGGLKRVRAHDGRFVLAAAPEQMLELLKTTGLTKVFDIADTVEQACAEKEA